MREFAVRRRGTCAPLRTCDLRRSIGGSLSISASSDERHPFPTEPWKGLPDFADHNAEHFGRLMATKRRFSWRTARALLRLVVSLLALTWAAVCVAGDPVRESVLILSQGLPGGPWPSAVHRAIRSVLARDSKAPVSDYIEELDLGRFGSSEHEQLLRRYWREKYRDRPIGVIIAVGSDALELLLRLREELWPNVPVVFAGVDETSATRTPLPRDVTGSTMRLRLSDAVHAAKILVPGLEKVFLVGSPLDRDPYRRHLAEELSQYRKLVQVIDASALTMAQLKGKVAALPEKSVIYYTAIYSDAAGVSYTPRDALRQIDEVANRPIVVDAETSIGYGPTGGFVITPSAIGDDAAERALRILKGENVATIPVSAGDSTKLTFDWRQLQRWNVDERALPAESSIRFRPATMWEQYSAQLMTMLAALVVQAAMIAWLLFERRGRNFAEMQSQVRLQQVIHLDRVAAVGAMSASIAHELNQPLGAIMANAETAELLLARDPVDHAQLKDILVDIRRSDERAVKIITHLRGLIRSRREAELQSFDVKDAINESLETLEAEARKRGVVMVAHQVDHPLPVYADRVHLEQAVLNLAVNAMDAMYECPPGKRTLRFETTLASHRRAMVSVSDSGPGIHPENLKAVFDAFYTTKPQGTGLGLSIVRTIVENCGGEIWAENIPGGGATFRFTIPLSTT